jgi:hypothetical protein
MRQLNEDAVIAAIEGLPPMWSSADAIAVIRALPASNARIDGDVWDFLMGAGPLEGCHFGDRHPTRKGAFWWRKVMSERSAMLEQESFDAWPGGLGDQLSAGVVGDIMKRAAQVIAAQDARIAEQSRLLQQAMNELNACKDALAQAERPAPYSPYDKDGRFVP